MNSLFGEFLQLMKMAVGDVSVVTQPNGASDLTFGQPPTTIRAFQDDEGYPDIYESGHAQDERVMVKPLLKNVQHVVVAGHAFILSSCPDKQISTPDHTVYTFDIERLD